jgi:hypothetical protein
VNLASARAFDEETLGLRVIDDTPFALVLDVRAGARRGRHHAPGDSRGSAIFMKTFGVVKAL